MTRSETTQDAQPQAPAPGVDEAATAQPSFREDSGAEANPPGSPEHGVATSGDAGHDAPLDADAVDHASPNAEDAARAAARTRHKETLGRTSETIVDALVATGRATGRVFGAIGGAAATAWKAVDPDLRRHILQLPLMGLTQLSPRDALIERLPDDGHLPVLFVHGLAGHPGNFGPMRAYFRVMGRSRTFSIGFASGQPIDLMARRLALAVEEIATLHELGPDDRIQIVAHSMGGIVTRLAMLRPEFAARIARIVTLGTPHSGTHAARFAATMQTLELRPGSRLLQQLAEQVPWNGPPLTAFWSPADMLILPAENASLDGAQSIRLDSFTHYSWLIDPRVWQAAWEVLSVDRPPTRRAATAL